jgi:hypothetical protein
VGFGLQLFRDQAATDALEARNALRQFRQAKKLIDASGRSLKLTPDMIRSLHHVLISDIYSCAGQYRRWSVKIRGSSHKPPHHRDLADPITALTADWPRSPDVTKRGIKARYSGDAQGRRRIE